MFPLQDLIQQRSHKALCACDLVNLADKEGRTMTSEEVAHFDAIRREIEELDAKINDIQTTSLRQQQIREITDRLSQPAGRQTAPEPPGGGAPGENGKGGSSQPVVTDTRTGGSRRHIRIPPKAFRTKPLRAFTGGGHAEEDAYLCGMWARAAIFGDPRCVRWCLENGVGTDIQNALATTPNTAGGFLVPEEFSQRVIDLREKYGVWRQNCYVQPMGRDTLLIPRRLTGVSVGPVGENAPVGESQPTWNQVRLTAKKVGGMTRMSTEIDEDAVIDLADWLAQEFAFSFALYEDQCGFIGDGTSTYAGIRGLTNIFTAASGLAGAVDAAAGHDTFAEIDAGDLITVMSKLPLYARPNAKWYVSSVGFDILFGRLLAALGGNSMMDVSRGWTPMYLGHPIVVSQVLPSSTGDLSDLPMLFFGDLEKAATMGDRRDIRIGRSDERYFELDQIAIKATERFDIVVHDVGSTTTAGPIVALVGE